MSARILIGNSIVVSNEHPTTPDIVFYIFYISEQYFPWTLTEEKSATNHGFHDEQQKTIQKSLFALKGFSPDEWITRDTHQDK